MPNCGCENYEQLTRRRFLGAAGAFGAGTFLGLWDPRTLLAKPQAGAPAKSVILLWMGGGQSHLDTWDPKPEHANGGSFQAIQTAAKGIRVCEHLPRLANEFSDISIVRSLTNKEGNHDRATYQLHTGRTPMASFQHSTYGSVAARELAGDSPELPPYVTINGRRWAAGHVGSAHAAFHIGSATEPAQNLSFHESVNSNRIKSRLNLLNELDKSFRKKHEREEVINAYAEHYRAAYRLMTSPASRAFDLSEEPAANRDWYGMTQFGQGCLLARRLVQEGVRFIEVNFGGWDTHQENFETVAAKCLILDQAFSSLVIDLRARNLLDQTLIVLCSEFGRTPIINKNSGRDHWPRVFSAVLAGGGIIGGRTIGASSRDGGEVRDRPVQVDELHTTICHQLGINSRKKIEAADSRPIRIVERRDAEPIKELLP